MPDAAVHASFGREVRKSLRKETGAHIQKAPYTFALFGPDIWFLYKPWKKRREGRGRRMHTTRTGEFLTELLLQARDAQDRDALFSYLSGFFCHYALDATAHPYVIHMTEEKHKFHRSHMSFEHTLDLEEMERAGVRNEKHPVTDHYLPKLRLPESLREDLDAVFERVYGWKKSWKALNTAAGRYHLCYRVIENPKGLFSRTARWTRSAKLKSLTYSESRFNGFDVENRGQQEWTHSHEPGIRSREDFAALREKARKRAVDLIESAYRFVYLSEGSEEEMREKIGNLSYLSGLPVDDPRNSRVASLQAPEKPEKRKK